ncbi:glutathione S-transferase family protein [Alphaproteobacteria bacterium]|nr:glutathione S-transferase family protein [Alphaproteobacteria bacterium]
MTSLFHHALCPFSRKIRLMLHEKSVVTELVDERPWERRLDFLMLNPSGEVPVLMDDVGVIAGHYPISEWLLTFDQGTPLLPQTPYEQAEVRRLTAWFDEKFHEEVGRLIVYEKIDRRFMSAQDGGGGPDLDTVRAGLHNLNLHMSYIEYLLERRDWLAGDDMSMADLTAAAHLSCIDYIGDISWKKWSIARDWYARIKSRPSFRPLLADHVSGVRPPTHYVDLDF